MSIQRLDRTALKNFPSSISIEDSYDVIVIGGGLAGFSAAIAAARLGCKTALVHDRPILGGNNSSELRVGISGADCSGNSLTRYPRETGMINELATENLYRNPIRDPAKEILSAGNFSITDIICWETVKKEENLTLFLNSWADHAVISEDDLIEGITVIQTSTEKRFSLKGKIFVDCSGDGHIATDAGAEYRVGREAKDEYGESLAPDVADHCVMGSTLIFAIKDMGHPVSFDPPTWAHRFPTDEDLPFRPHNIKKEGEPGFWWLAYGGGGDTIGDNDKIYEELLRILSGLWDHIKNCGDHGAENMALDWIAPLPAKRESRRFIGDYVLNENDVRNAILFPDRVAYGGWPIDIHPPEGIYSSEPPNISVDLQDVYSIPFRCLYSRNIRNLLMAGRNISVTHVALGSTRVMATCAVIGQAAGTAASLCVKYGLTPRELGQKKIVELQQQLLKDDCYIIGIRNEDSADLARGATIQASSERKLQAETVDEFQSLDLPRAQLLSVSASRIESIELFLRSTLTVNRKARLGLRRAKSINNFSSEVDVSEAEAVIPAMKSTWVKFKWGTDTEPGKLYWIQLPVVEGIFCGCQKEAPVGTNRATYNKDSSRWEAERGSYAFRLSPASWPYSATNVTNGVTRPETWPNLWISDPTEPFPQFLDINFEVPQKIDTVYLTFDGNLDTNIYLSPPWGILGTTNVIRECVRDYALYFDNGSSWVKIVQVVDNYQRHRVHLFEPISTKRLRLEVQATNGIPEARVFEIRVYAEGIPRHSSEEYKDL